ncbi:allophanate hydrolase [Acididesulfobacillus acetoxydans]|uniref:Allophanate hydrolase n=1 Tax=Acididesulfobacillus acetoxydans TaxID=1561005 RepID=A0A8S0Y1K2_9FIRM|nr:5-oxoprolinase subunit PxpB [Acididesulfobacillus acetoxydans]CAA7599545.1 allophanate hydrolase [Acididesulfobacillus acetoxydans]CEJ07740.1 Kinase A inhibitor [Acididesulfobacillus acetoxydans]
MFVVNPFGDSAVHVQLGSEVNEAVFHRVRAFAAWMEAKSDERIGELIPGYLAVTLFIRSGADGSEVARWLAEQGGAFEQALAEAGAGRGRVAEIPVCYGGEYGPDLEYVAGYHGLTTGQVIALHTGTEYLVHMLGFMPGFPYLGGLPLRLATPRLATPRAEVARGSVGIAGSQTGIYPLASPGGWQIIGRTPLRLFDPAGDPPTLLQSGDRIRFIAVGKEEYSQLSGKNKGKKK